MEWSSESLSLAGIGMTVASRRESSASPEKSGIRLDVRAALEVVEGWSPVVARCWGGEPEEEGGDAGRVVCMALRIVDGRVGDPPMPEASGEESRLGLGLEKTWSETGEGGDGDSEREAAFGWETDGVIVGLLTERGAPLEKTRERGGLMVEFRKGDEGRRGGL